MPRSDRGHPVVAAELDEQIEIVAGRRAPFTMLGDWVALSGIDDHAKALYWCLSMHVNVTRGDTEVWPSRYTLAEWCGFAKAESVDRYLAQLVDLGAVEIRQHRHAGGMRARNRYIVHGNPPDDYTGARSLHEWYQRRRAEADPEPARSPLQRTTAPPAETRETPAQPVVRSSGLPESAPADLGSPLQRTVTKTKNNKTNTTTRARARTAPAPATLPKAEGEGETPPKDDEHQAAAELLRALPAPWRLGVRAVRELAPAVSAALAAGWSPTALGEYLAANPDGVKAPAAVLASRLHPEVLPAPPRACRPVEPLPRTGPRELSQSADAERFDAITTAIGPDLYGRIVASRGLAAEPQTRIRARINGVYRTHGHDVEAIRAHAEALPPVPDGSEPVVAVSA